MKRLLSGLQQKVNAGIGWQQPCIQPSQTEVRVEVWVHCDGNVASGVFWGASYGAASVWILAVCWGSWYPVPHHSLRWTYVVLNLFASAAHLWLHSHKHHIQPQELVDFHLRHKHVFGCAYLHLSCPVATCHPAGKLSNKKTTQCARTNILHCHLLKCMLCFKQLSHHSKNRINMPPTLSLDKGAAHPSRSAHWRHASKIVTPEWSVCLTGLLQY